MHIQEYTTVLNYQSDCVDRTRKQIDLYFHNRFVNTISPTSSLKKKVSKLTSFFIEQLLASKGLVSTVKEKFVGLKNRDLTDAILGTDRLIKVFIDLKDTLDSVIFEDLHHMFPQLHLQQELLLEIIDNLYDVLRMLKKQNLKKSIETTQNAIDLSSHSVFSLETVSNGHRTT